MSYAGKRALVCMKHVGMNVCADAFVNSAITGVNGGLIVLAADDPSMHSSQNEQDSRFYAKFAMIPAFEPSNQQEAYDMMKTAFEYSEAIKEPVVLRIVTRLAHSRAGVETGELLDENKMNASTDQWVLLPGIAKKKYAALIDKQPAMIEASEKSIYNKVETVADKKLGVIACGIGYNYVKEAVGDNANILKISQYPLPAEKVMQLAKECDEILVVEDGQPVVEEEARRIIGDVAPIKGRYTGDLPRYGELTPDSVAKALGVNLPEGFAPAKNLAARPPQLCQGCGHRDVYAALRKTPFKALASCVDMGASITMAKGAADAGLRPSIAIIGDSTFTHSGMTGLLDAINDNSPITVIISDNLTTGMTGGQDSAGTNKFEAICLGLGMDPEHLHVVTPLPKNIPAIADLIRKELAYEGVSVIIPRRECIQTASRHAREKAKAKEGAK